MKYFSDYLNVMAAQYPAMSAVFSYVLAGYLEIQTFILSSYHWIRSPETLLTFKALDLLLQGELSWA